MKLSVSTWSAHEQLLSGALSKLDFVKLLNKHGITGMEVVEFDFADSSFESMKELCIRFNDAYSGIILNREYFFQPSYDKACLTKHNIDDFFELVEIEPEFDDPSFNTVSVILEFPSKHIVHFQKTD